MLDDKMIPKALSFIFVIAFVIILLFLKTNLISLGKDNKLAMDPDVEPIDPIDNYQTTHKKTDSKDDRFVENGDIVSINYIVRDANGTIYDTSYPELAPESESFNPEGRYAPLTFEVGTEKVIRGLDQGVLGMREKEERFLSINPNLGYGKVNMDLVHVVSSVTSLPRIQNISIQRFMDSIDMKPIVGLKYNFSGENSTIVFPITVLDIQGSNVVIRFDQVENMSFKSVFGMARIDFGDDLFNLTVNPELKRYTTRYGVGKVIDINDSMFTIDYNHELAGKEIFITAQLVELKKPGDPPKSLYDYINITKY